MVNKLDLQSIISKYQASGSLREFNLRVTAGNKINLQYSTNGTTASTLEAPETLVLGTPYIFYFGYNNGTLFLRGDKITTVSVASAAINNNTTALSIFERNAGDRANMALAEVGFARRAWRGQEIVKYQDILNKRWVEGIGSINADNSLITVDNSIITVDRM
jgi:hypothetical protein